MLHEALNLPTDSQAHQLAQSLSERLETSLTELGLDVNDMYHMSRGDQLQLISQVTDKVLSNQDMGELARLVEQEQKTLFNETPNHDIIKPDKIVEGHSSTPKIAPPSSVIDHINAQGKVDIRTFYGDDGLKKTEIHTGNHGNCKTHHFGQNGEHAHDYVWNADGTINTKKARELTDAERERNGSII